MASTYEPIATTTLSSAASSITFSSIPSTYTDLRVVLFVKTAGYDTGVQFNSDTATNYSFTGLRGDGTTATSWRATAQTQILLDWAASTNSFFTIDVFNYAGSTYKTALVTGNEDANGSGTVSSRVGLWRSTAAITTLTLAHGSNFQIGTSATLYGIKAA